jgi:hypothetical protein
MSADWSIAVAVRVYRAIGLLAFAPAYAEK